MTVAIEMGQTTAGAAGDPGPRGTAGDPPAGAGQFGLRQIASAAPAAGTERALGAADHHRSRRRFRLAGRAFRPSGDRCRGAYRTRPAGRRRAGAHASRLHGAQSRRARRREPDAARRRLPRRAVRGRPRPLVSDAGGGGRGAAVRAGGRRRGLRRSAQALARRHDQPDVPRPQARAGRHHRHAAAGEARQERRGRSLQLPDGPHLPRHRHGARRRPARHGAAAGGSVSRSRARAVHGARPGAVAPAAAACASARPTPARATPRRG